MFKFFFSFIVGLMMVSVIHASDSDVMHLQEAYPQYIDHCSKHAIHWIDGTMMPLDEGKPDKTPEETLNHPSLRDQVDGVDYQKGVPYNVRTYTPGNDAGRIRYEPFFRKMYGNTKEEVMTHLVTIHWMPRHFGFRYPLQVTTMNHVDEKFIRISEELDALLDKHPKYIRYVDAPVGTFSWRLIAHTNRISMHSFGMTIDLNTMGTHYWQWDLARTGQPIEEDTPLVYPGLDIPWDIVLMFEKYGFIWGGKWEHYDTMHFEYRPELLLGCCHAI